MIKVSVIVPVYNTEKYLNRCLDSLVNQSLKEIEILVINDCSTDNSKNILDEYEKKYQNIKVFHNKTNKGIGYNRNLGIKKASGEFIGFIDSDDWVEKNMFEKMYNKAKRDNLDLVICNYFRKLMKEDELIDIESDFNIKYFDNTSLEKSPNLLLDINTAPWNKLYKKELIENIKFPEDLKYEDAVFVMESLAEAKNIGMVEDKLNYYLVRSKSETTVMNEKVFDILTITKIIENNFKKTKYYDDIKDFVEAYIITNLFRYTLQQKYQEDKLLKTKFIDEVFNYLNDSFPNWKKNKIWKKRSFAKRLIESNKILTKLYCKIMKS